MAGTEHSGIRTGQAGADWLPAGVTAAYAAAVVGIGYAVISLYWALGGSALLSTVGGYAGQTAQQGGALALLLALAAALLKLVGGLLALALARPWRWRVPRRLLLVCSTGASAVLLLYGGLNMLLEGLVLADVIHPGGDVNRNELRWYLCVWDLWFFVWGILLALATISYWRRSAHPGRPLASRGDACR